MTAKRRSMILVVEEELLRQVALGARRHEPPYSRTVYFCRLTSVGCPTENRKEVFP
jgi:hypothetical protein